MATPTPMKAGTAHAQTLSPSALAPSFAVSPTNKYQCEEKRDKVGEFFKTSSSKEWEEKQTANKSQHEERRNGDRERFKMSLSKEGEESQSISSYGSQDQEQTLKVQMNSVVHDKSWPMDNIINPGIHDCLMGRGGGTNHHPGNKLYRAITESKKPKYLASKRLDKPLVAMEVIKEWRSLHPMGRFLKQNQETKFWYDVGDRKAREKTSQALREKITYLPPDEDKSEDRGENVVVVGERISGHRETICDENISVHAPNPQQFKKGVWTEDEMQLVREARKEFGNKWSEVAKRVPGRSEMSVKNWWYNHQTSEKRKRKRQDGEACRNLVAKYNHALTPASKNHQGQQHGYADSLIDCSQGAIASSGKLGSANGHWIVESSGSEDICEFGAIGHSFKRRIEDKTGQDLGWFVGTVVDILCGTDKSRRCLYYAIGFVEDLSMDDLKELAQLEESQN